MFKIILKDFRKIWKFCFNWKKKKKIFLNYFTWNFIPRQTIENYES